MSILRFEGVVTARLERLSLSLGAGVHAVVGGVGDGTEDLARVAVGTIRPRRGQVRVRDVDPFRSPSVRARCPAVFGHEPVLPLVGSARDALARLLSLSGSRVDAVTALDDLGLAPLARRAARSLDAGERRSLALAAALALPEPAVLVLCEPGSDLPAVSVEVVREQLAERARAGACVVVLTARPRDAALFAPEAMLLEHGALVRRVTLAMPDPVAAGGNAEYTIRCAAPRELTAALTREPAVASVLWDAESAPDEVRARGRDAAALSTAILRVCRDGDFALRSMVPRREGLETLHAASAAMSRVAYEAAYAAGRRGGASS